MNARATSSVSHPHVKKIIVLESKSFKVNCNHYKTDAYTFKTQPPITTMPRIKQQQHQQAVEKHVRTSYHCTDRPRVQNGGAWI